MLLENLLASSRMAVCCALGLRMPCPKLCRKHRALHKGMSELHQH